MTLEVFSEICRQEVGQLCIGTKVILLYLHIATNETIDVPICRTTSKSRINHVIIYRLVKG